MERGQDGIACATLDLYCPAWDHQMSTQVNQDLQEEVVEGTNLDHLTLSKQPQPTMRNQTSVRRSVCKSEDAAKLPTTGAAL